MLIRGGQRKGSMAMEGVFDALLRRNHDELNGFLAGSWNLLDESLGSLLGL